MNLVPYPPFSSGRRLSTRSAKGFTLVELLTVIALIGILAAILFPVVGRVRESAKASQCTTHLRQIGIAIQSYVSDNKGSLPPGTPWITPTFNADPRNFQSALIPYVNITKNSSWAANSGYLAMFGCPGYKGETGSHYVLPQTVLNDDGTLLKLANGKNFNPWPHVYQNPSNGAFVTPAAIKHAVIPPKNKAITDRDFSVTTPNHSGFQNVLYFDWHVGRVPVAN